MTDTFARRGIQVIVILMAMLVGAGAYALISDDEPRAAQTTNQTTSNEPIDALERLNQDNEKAVQMLDDMWFESTDAEKSEFCTAL